MPVPLLNPYLDLFLLLERQPDELRLAARKKLIWAYSWAVPSAEAIGALAGRGPWVELGAGTGYWTWLLRQAGAGVLAWDLHPGVPLWSEVKKASAASVDVPSDHALFLCWPPLDDSMAEQAVDRYSGSCLAVVGEFGQKARTGSASFQKRLAQAWSLEAEIILPRWPGFQDSLRIYQRET
jgi:hypothetical protein